MPRMTASRCRTDNAIPCKQRAEAQSPGVWHSDAVGWLWSDGAFILSCSHCPYCGFPLPAMRDAESDARFERIWAAVKKAIRRKDAPQ